MRIALVVGGTSGLGREVALLLEGDHEVHVAARKPDVNPWFPFHPCDITKGEDRQRLVTAFPRLDALIITTGSTAEDVEAVNHRGPVSLAMDLLPALKGGSVTFVSSTAAWSETPYGEAKGNLERSVDELSQTLVGVRVNAVRPTHILDSGMTGDIAEGERTVTKAQVAEAIVFLVCNDAVNGVILPLGENP